MVAPGHGADLHAAVTDRQALLGVLKVPPCRRSRRYLAAVHPGRVKEPGNKFTWRRGGPVDLAIANDIHDRFYVQTGMYDAVFNDYVAASTRAFAAAWDDARDAVWIAERDGTLVGFVAVCHRPDDGLAQLRYLYVDPAGRGHGLGTRLVQAVVDFATEAGYPGIMLWTMEGLESAARIYRAFGWEMTETAAAPWHPTLMQQRHDLRLD